MTFQKDSVSSRTGGNPVKSKAAVKTGEGSVLVLPSFTTESQRRRETRLLRKPFPLWFLQVRGFLRDSVTPW